MKTKQILVALLVLLALVGTAAAADSVEIRSTVLHFNDVAATDASINAKNWAGLYYNLDNDVWSEELILADNGTAIDITYTTAPVFQAYAYDWQHSYIVDDEDLFADAGYAILGFFAEPYVALGPVDLSELDIKPFVPPLPSPGLTTTVDRVAANKIAKLIIDDDEKYTLKTGATLELGEGYSIIVDQIDVDGNKAYLRLMKDGQELNSSIVNTNQGALLNSGGDWIYKLTVLNEKDRQVMRVHVKDVFQGTQDSLVEIEGLWMVDYQNAFEVKADVDYDKFETKDVNKEFLQYVVEEQAMSADTDTVLGRGIILRTEQNYSSAAPVPVPDPTATAAAEAAATASDAATTAAAAAVAPWSTNGAAANEALDAAEAALTAAATALAADSTNATAATDAATAASNVAASTDDATLATVAAALTDAAAALDAAETALMALANANAEIPAVSDKFYLFKEYTEAGTYEIRSSVYPWNVAIDDTFFFENFAAFYYDIDTDISTEWMELVAGDGKTVEDGDLTYETTPQMVDYAYDGWEYDGFASIVDGRPIGYYIMGLFGEKYVLVNVVDVDGFLALNPQTSLKPEKMAKLVMDSDEKFTLKTGATLELGEGYSLIVDQIDVDGNKAYLRFLKDGKEVNSSIVNTRDNALFASGGDWIFRNTILNEKNVQVLRVHVKDVFQGTESSLVEIEGIWATDYVNATEIKSEDKYGILEFTGVADAPTISGDVAGKTLGFKSDGDFTINADMDKQIANNMYLKTADNDTAGHMNYYFYVNAIIGDGGGPVTPTPTPTEPTPTPTEPAPPSNGTDNGSNNTPDPVGPDEPGFFEKYMWYIIGAIVLIIIIAGAAYYFMVYKKA